MFKKFKIIILLFLSIISSCGFSGILTQDNDDVRKHFESQEKIDWAIVKLEKWKWRCGNKNCAWIRKLQIRHVGTTMTNYTGIGVATEIDNKVSNSKKSYETIQEFGDEYLLYVGKWQYVEKIGTEIRLISTNNNNDKIMNYFETKDENNKNIPYRPLKLPTRYNEENGYKGQGEAIGEIIWYDTYGYNAYLDLKTGEIKQAKK